MSETTISRRDAAELIFKYIKELGFTPYNVEYGDGYFIIDLGEDGNCHFQIKELRGWKFAMWINTNESELKNENGKDYPAIQFFCQHKVNIDKFKPSRSFFCAEFSYEDVCDMQADESWKMYEIKQIIKMIKRHPFVAFAMDEHESQFCYHSYILNYISRHYDKYSYLFSEWLKDMAIFIPHSWKPFFIKRYKVVDTIEFIDRNSDGWKTYPRYEMRIHFKVISDDEEIQNKAEVKILNRWFRKPYYRNMNIDLTRDGIEGSYYYATEESK